MDKLSTISESVDDRASGGYAGFTPREAYSSGIRGFHVSDYPLSITEKEAAENYAKAGRLETLSLGWIPLIGLFTACLGIIFPIVGCVFANKSQKLYEHGFNLPAKIYFNRARTMHKITEIVFYVGLVASLAAIVVVLFRFEFIVVASNDDK